MATKHLGILQALQAVTQAALPGVPVTVGRTRAISTDTAQAVDVSLDTSQVAVGLEGGRYGWRSTFDVRMYARAAGDTSPQEAVDPLLSLVFDALLADDTLGGLAVDVNPDESDTLRWEADEQAEKLCCCTARFAVLHYAADRSVN